jgi:hypothetical protein
MQIVLDPKSLDSYRKFLEVKKLPAWNIRGRLATFPDEYANRLGMSAAIHSSHYAPEPFLYDYQKAIAATAVNRKKFAIFADCGLGKTHILLSWCNYVRQRIGKRVLIITPPLVVPQLIEEAKRFWGNGLPIRRVRASELAAWLSGECAQSVGITNNDACEVGVTNYEALKDSTPQGNLGALVLDESSILKSHYGKYGQTCLRLGRGLDWKLCCTGTPAPNDRIEYANHAVFLDRFPTVNSFLAKYFINRGQTGERWELKAHALRPFYRSLSDWCIFLTNPSTYGWKDNVNNIPPIHVHILDVPMTDDQKAWVHKELGSLIAVRTGGITKRAAYGQVSKGLWKGQKFETNKPGFIRDLVNSWPEESTLIWCIYDHEQDSITAATKGESMYGETPMAERLAMIRRFKDGESRILISKPKILGFGLNLQVATRQVFSGLQDSYESYYQAVKRSNRIGSTKPLNVHIPVTDLEVPMVENVLRKAHRVEHDTREQEELFKQCTE